MRWGLWLSMFGSYLLLVPVALLLLRWLRQDDPVVADLSTVAAGFYILLGAAGASVLASTLPDLIQRYADADAAIRAGLLNDFDLARRIAEDGLQGVVQNVAGAAWFLGMGSLLRRHRPALGAAAIAVGAFLVVNAAGIMVDVEALRFIGLTCNVLPHPPGYRHGHLAVAITLTVPTGHAQVGRCETRCVRRRSRVDLHADQSVRSLGSPRAPVVEPRRGRGVRASFQPTFGGGPGDGFVTKLNPRGSRLVYSTFVGGSGADGAHDGELDKAGNFYIDGFTDSTDFPVTPGAFQPTYGGGEVDAWVAKLNKTGSALVYSTYLGGTGPDAAGSVRVNRDGVAHVPGTTDSTDFPVTPGAFQTENGGAFDVFLVKVDLGKRYKGSGHQTASVTAQEGTSSGRGPA